MSKEKYIDKGRIAIILCTYNGEKFLKQQLNTIKYQTYREYDLFISDDGSSDSTLKIVNEFINDNPLMTIHILKGPKIGFAKNFIRTLQDIPSISERDYLYYAFCDQDDLWDVEKLGIAIKKLKELNFNGPALYCSRTKYVDSNGIDIGYSPLFKKKPSFNNALVQSIAGGNTMLFNDILYNYLLKVDTNKNIVSHDWLTYLICMAANGIALYDNNPYISYRQHQANIIGSNNSVLKIYKRLKLMLSGNFSKWINSNLLHLDNLELSQNNNKILKNFYLVRSKNIFTRFKGLILSKVYRQTFFGNITLILSTALKKIM